MRPSPGLGAGITRHLEHVHRCCRNPQLRALPGNVRVSSQWCREPAAGARSGGLNCLHFGPAALPLAWAFWALCTFSVGFTDFTQVGAHYLVGLPLLWVSCLAVTFVIAGFFVATPNAIAYEELLLVPVFVASGVLFTESSAPAWLDALGTLIPIQAPVKVLLGQMPMNSFGDFLGMVVQTCAVTALWMLAGYLLGRRALRAATVHGTLGAI